MSGQTVDPVAHLRELAKVLGVKTLALTARDGGRIRGMVDLCLVVV